MDALLQDLRYSLRMLRREPRFALVAVLALSLGIGANTALFSVVNAVLLRPLPYPDPARLVSLGETPPDGVGRLDLSYPNFLDWQRDSRALESVGGWMSGGATLTGVSEAAQLGEAWVTPALFDLLGAAPAQGRGFRAEEQQPGGPAVVVVSHGFWQRRLGGDPDVLGKVITLDAAPCTLIGVMKPGLALPDGVEAEVWRPLGSLADQPFLLDREVHVVRTMGRLGAGSTLAAAQAELETLVAGIHARFPSVDRGHGVRAVALHEATVGDVRPALLLLLGAVACVLLIACANVANLLLARGAARSREMALRTLLGASRARTLRQLLTESVLLGLIGGGCGLLLAAWGIDLLRAALADLLPRADGIRLDGGILAFTLGISLLTGLLFGLVPALQAWRDDLNTALKEQGHAATASRGPQRLRHALIVAEVALSLVLLAGAGLLTRSFWNVLQEPAGFDPENLLLVKMSLPAVDFPESGQVVSFYRDLPARLERLPGVRTVSAVNLPPISGGDANGVVTIEDNPFNPGQAPGASFRRVLPSYFRAMGIPLVRGREFDAGDDGTVDVVLINETMARRYWRDGEAVGSRIKVGPAEREPWLTVVGVVGDVRNVGLDQAPTLATYEPHAQRPWRTMQLAIRTGSEPAALAATVRRALLELEPRLLVSDIATMQQRISRSLASRSLNVWLLAVFAGVALSLTCVGIYGVMGYAVTQRTREIGLRAALGARRRDLLALVIGHGMRLALTGAVIGTAVALAMTRLMAGMLYGVAAADPGTFLVIPLILLAAALFASYLPARRAARLDPMTALRLE